MNTAARTAGRGTLVLAIVAQIAGLISLAGWLLGAVFAIMLADGYTPERASIVWTLIAFYWAMPVLVCLASVAMWICRARGRETGTRILAVFLLLSFLLLVALQLGA